MLLTNVLILSGIVGAFLSFGIALAWGEYQTRHLNRAGADYQQIRTEESVEQLKKAA
jgi:hypothetical protein